jgi:hypothetical protein
MRLTTVVLLALALLLPDREAAARRRAVRCCIMVPDDMGGERPYCFVLDVRPARYARRVCRLIDGQPYSIRDV